MITDERRAFKRVRLEFHIRYYSITPNVNISGDSCTSNISSGGVFFNAFAEIPIGSVIECRISIPQKTDAFRFLSRVVRCDRFSDTVVSTFGIAAEFIKSFENSDSHLRQMLASL